MRGQSNLGKCGIPAGDFEDVVLDLVEATPGQDAAHLRFFAEGDDVGLDAEGLVRPEHPGNADAALHLVEDQERVVFEGEGFEGLEKLGPEVMVAAFALDRLDKDAGDVVFALAEIVPGLRQRPLFALNDLLQVFVERKRNLRIGNAWPVELGKVFDLAQIGRIRQRERVAAASVEGFVEVQHLMAYLAAIAFLKILPHLPVEGRLQGIFDGERAPGDEKRVGQIVRHGDALEGSQKTRHVDGADVGVGDFIEGGFGQARHERSVVAQLGVIHPEGAGAVEAEEIDQLLAAMLVVEIDALAPRHVEHHGHHAPGIHVVEVNSRYVLRPNRIDRNCFHGCLFFACVEGDD